MFSNITNLDVNKIPCQTTVGDKIVKTLSLEGVLYWENYKPDPPLPPKPKLHLLLLTDYMTTSTTLYRGWG